MPKFAIEAAHILLPIDKIRRWQEQGKIEVQFRGLAEVAVDQLRAEHPFLLWRLNELVIDEQCGEFPLHSREQVIFEPSRTTPNKLEDLEQTPVLRGLIAAARQVPTDRVVRAVLLDYLVEEARLETARAQALIETIERRVWARQQLRCDTDRGRQMRCAIYFAVGLGYGSKVRIVVLCGDDVEQPPQLEHVAPWWTHKTKNGRRCPCPDDRQCCGQNHVYHRARSRVTVGELVLLEMRRADPHTLIV